MLSYLYSLSIASFCNICIIIHTSTLLTNSRGVKYAVTGPDAETVLFCAAALLRLYTIINHGVIVRETDDKEQNLILYSFNKIF